MLDIRFIRENADKVKKATADKQLDSALVDKVLELDEKRRDLLGRVEELRAKRNKIAHEGKVSEEGKKLKEELVLCKKEREEYLSGWQRSRADYINLKKEGEQTREVSARATEERILRELIFVLDSFEIAFANKEQWEKVDSGWREGVEYIYSQLLDILREFHVQKIESLGKLFDPAMHESMAMLDTDDKEKQDTVAEVVSSGYIWREKVLRPAKVKIWHLK